MSKEMTFTEWHQSELETMKAFHRFCVQNGLRYYLSGGSLLGAVRHKGFIPWADDIDVQMPRADFMRMIELTPDGRIDEHYRLASIYHSEDIRAPYSFAAFYDDRISVKNNKCREKFSLTAGIDITAIDGMAPTAFGRRCQLRAVRLLVDLYYLCATKVGGKRRSQLVTALQYCVLPVLPLIRLGWKFYLKLQEKICLQYDLENSEYAQSFNGLPERKIMRTEWLEPAILMDFEDTQFYVEAHYNEILTALYGDYMTPPPVDKRITHGLIGVKQNTEVPAP